MARVPLYIEFSDKSVLIIGGGYVGTKRALKFLEAGAHVIVIALKPSSELIRASSMGNVDLVIADANTFNYDRVMDKINLLVYAIPTNSELKYKLRRLASERRILFNDTTNAGETEVVVPFEGEVNGIRFAVTSEGKSGVAASMVRDYIQATLSRSDIHPIVNAWYEAKQLIKKLVDDPHVRMRLYFMLKGDERFLEIARSGDINRVVKYVSEVIKNHEY
ncbi:MAG: bifunctional precorrin-2 dehydrogenase/sirohydrochlorin ferrochelatase [Caldivirga sp.]